MIVARLTHILALAGMVITFAHPARAELTAEQQQVPLEQDAGDKSLAKVVLLAGPPSNKPGQHEYFAGCALMLDWLKKQPGIRPVMAAEGWPKNEAILDNAKAVLIYMDGGEKCALLEGTRWQKLKSLMDAGAGFIALHQSVDMPEAKADDLKSWLGAVWQKDIGSRGHWDMSFDSIPRHEVTQGVTPFAAPKDGWLYNLHFAEKGITPLFTGQVPDTSRSTDDAKAHPGRAEVIAWAYERPNGGRSVGFTGCDLHSSWGIESQRRFLLNAVLWTAKVNVPQGGAVVPACGEQELAVNLDRKSLPLKKAKTKTAATNAR